MSNTPGLPTYYRTISRAFFEEVLQELQNGAHIAVIAARQSGKALVLSELRRLALLIPKRDRPRVVTLRSLDLQNETEHTFAKRFADAVGYDRKKVRVNESFPLASAIFEIIRAALKEHLSPLWIFAQNITEFPEPLARGLLAAFQAASQDSQMKQRLSVVITGSPKFVPLTYHENSPYRQAKKYFLTGFDREITELFLASRILGFSVDHGFSAHPSIATLNLQPEVVGRVYNRTGGYAKLIEEVVLTANRPGAEADGIISNGSWTVDRIDRLVRKFLREHIGFETFCNLSLKEVERDSDAWELLQKLIDQPPGAVTLEDSQPHLIETSGIARRDEHGKLGFSSPIWETYIRRVITPIRRADNYAILNQWDHAWKLYEGQLVSDCDRPSDGEERYRFEKVIANWESNFIDRAVNGSADVFKFFHDGAQHLLGFGNVKISENQIDLEDSARQSKSTDSLLPNELIPSRFSDEQMELSIYPGRLEIESSPIAGMLGPKSSTKPSIHFVCRAGREFEFHRVPYLQGILHRFWQAYLTARRNEYDATIGAMRERHLQVVAKVNELLSLYPGNMRKVVEGTVDALVEIGEYYRVLICLISPDGQHIQAVAGRCKDPRFDFDFPTNYRINRNSFRELWDIQEWVVIRGEKATVRDASDPNQTNPKTNFENCKRIGMEAIAVIPIILRRNGVPDEILGTIHFERVDKKLPSEVELESLEILTSQVAVAFDQARRLTMLEQAIVAVKGRFRIISPDRRELFPNRHEIDESTTKEPTWNYPVSYPVDSIGRQSRFDSLVVEEASRQNRGVSRYSRIEKDELQVCEEFAAPIYDFRNALDGTFRSDGRLGFVYQSHELTEILELHETLQRWLGNGNTRATASQILDYYAGKGHKWCRIYLYDSTEKPDACLKSYAEFGIIDRFVREKFAHGEYRIYRNEEHQQSWYLIKHFRQPAIFCFDAKLVGAQQRDPEDKQGIVRIRTTDNWRSDFAKSDPEWIEAPLLFGGDVVGLIAISMPPNFSPEWYEIFSLSVVNVAVALNNAVRTEQEANRGREEAWQSAAQLAIHQLANKLAPAESSCHFVHQWLQQNDRFKQDPDFAKVELRIRAAERGIETSRNILNDFRRYASDQLVQDIRRHRLSDLLGRIRDELYSINQDVSIQVDAIPAEIEVQASYSGLIEVFEVLFHNSLLHSAKPLSELKITISVDPISEADQSIERNCRIIYCDNGRGIPDKLREKIFDPFFTTHQKGNGLGLAIARKILNCQRATISEEGHAGSGARFRIDLPVSPQRISSGGVN